MLIVIFFILLWTMIFYCDEFDLFIGLFECKIEIEYSSGEKMKRVVYLKTVACASALRTIVIETIGFHRSVWLC